MAERVVARVGEFVAVAFAACQNEHAWPSRFGSDSASSPAPSATLSEVNAESTMRDVVGAAARADHRRDGLAPATSTRVGVVAVAAANHEANGRRCRRSSIGVGARAAADDDRAARGDAVATTEHVVDAVAQRSDVDRASRRASPTASAPK